MSVQVKICGLNDRASAEAALRAGVDFAGLVFFPPSPRHLRPEQARAVAQVLSARTRVVGLFVDPADDDIRTALSVAPLDILQLHGKETPERVAEIKARFGKPIIKAVPVTFEVDLARGHIYEPVADYLMFDAKADPEATRPGGHGAAFDWKVLSGASFKRPWFLAGGLTVENVARAVQVSGAQMVDTSSGVEDQPGVKNIEKIAAFATAARNAQYTNGSSTVSA
jgi:phosphoribosylanthranilate isomerase